MSGAGPEVLSGLNQRPERFSIPPFHLLQERTYLRHQTRYALFLVETNHFIALIHPIQWTIAKPVGADRPAKRQKKTSCVSTGWPVPVLCIRQVAHGIYFLSRQHDVIASFSFGACTVQTCFHHLQIF